MKKLTLLIALTLSIFATAQNGLTPSSEASPTVSQNPHCDAFHLNQWDGADYFFEEDLKIWQTENGQHSIASIQQSAPFFGKNQAVDNAQANEAIYWLQVPLCNQEQTSKTYLFDLDPDNYRWENIEAHLVKADGQTVSQTTGSHLAKAEKPIYSEKHLLQFSIEQNEQVQLYIKLQKPLPKALKANQPLQFRIALIEEKNHPGYFKGYPFIGHFDYVETDYPFNGNAIVNHEWYIDESGTAHVDEVVQSWNQLNQGNMYNTVHEVAKVYWMKAQFYGSEAFKGDHMLHVAPWVGMDNFSFDYIDVYTINQRGKQKHQRLGDQVPTDERPYEFWANFIQLQIAPTDTVDLYVRMEGSIRFHLMPYMGLFHIDPSTVFPNQTNEAKSNGIFYGILIIQIAFFFLLFLIEKDKIHLYFSLTGLGILLGVAFNNIGFKFYDPIPAFRNYQIPLYTCGILMSQFGFQFFTSTYFNYPKDSFYRKWIIPVFMTAFALISLNLVFQFEFIDANGVYYNKTSYYLAFVFFMLVSILIGLTMAIKAPKQYAVSKKYFLTAFTPLIFTVILFLCVQLSTVFQIDDAFISKWHTSTWEMVKISVVALLMFLALSIGNRTNRLKAEKAFALKKNLEDQKRINQAISKFVPNEFLSALGKTNITEVKLGDHIEKEVTVLFSDMRNFTGISEQMSPEANFKFVYEFNNYMGPIIQKNHGFVNQYLGDGIMAIFPNSANDALQAAIEMQTMLRRFNQKRKEKGKPIIKIGIGMHTGPLVMGIIGDEHRMDAATISDSVNTASRIEALTKHYGSSILISGTCHKIISDQTEHHFRYLGEALLKGKKDVIKIYECIDGDSTSVKSKKLSSLHDFNRGVNLYFQKDFTRAALAMESILMDNPNDETANTFLHKSKEYEVQGVKEDWTGVEEYKRQ